MNVAVLGCGAIGGVLAACLTRAGLRVTPITGNPTIALALAQRGYRVRDLDGSTWSVMPSGTPLVSAADTGDATPAPFDLVILATQSTRLASALESVRPRLAPDAKVVVCQNGLPEDRAGQIVGAERVVGCVVSWGASMIEPGLYLRTSRGTCTLGRIDRTDRTGRPDPIDRPVPIHAVASAPDSDPTAPVPAPPAAEHDLTALAHLLECASPAHVATDFAGVRWSKLAINCCTTTIGAVGGAPLGPLLRHRFARRIALEVFAEVNAVARASGVTPAPVGGTLDIEKVSITDAERRLRLGSPSLFVKHSILLAVGFKYRRLRSSMLYALERGRPPEIDFLNGEVVRRGLALGVPTPVNQALVEAVRAIVAGQSKSSLSTLREVHRRIAGPLLPPADSGDSGMRAFS